MITSVYLSNEAIIVISGKASEKRIKVTDFYSAAMPEGSIINGVITNEEAVKQALLLLRKKGVLPKKNIRLVIDSSAVMMKSERVPALPHKKLMEFVRNTFTGMTDAHEELLYDYAVIDGRGGEGNGCTILCSAVEKSAVGVYISLFKEAGVSLKSVDIALNCMIKLMKYYTALKKQTYVLSVMDANFMSSFLFVNGKYGYSSRSRLLVERGTPESAGEISRVISSIIQFNKSQKSEYDVTNSYFSRLNEKEQGLCNEISALLNISCMPTPFSRSIVCKRKITKKGVVLSNYPFAIGNLIVK